MNQKDLALTLGEVKVVWDEANAIADEVKENHPCLDAKTLFKGLLATNIRKKWEKILNENGLAEQQAN